VLGAKLVSMQNLKVCEDDLKSFSLRFFCSFSTLHENSLCVTYHQQVIFSQLQRM